jgi:hypothetical protein
MEGLADMPPVLSDIGLPTFQSMQWATDYWKNVDGINAPYAVRDQGNTTIRTAENKANGTAVEEDVIHGGGHIPDDRQHLLQHVWDFLNAHPRRQPPKLSDDHIQQPDKPIESWTTVRQLQDDLDKRGVHGIESDLDRVFDAALDAPNGSLQPAKIYADATELVHLRFSDPVSEFINDTREIRKEGDTISVERDNEATIPVNAGFGPGMLKSVSIGNVSFQMAKNGGFPELKNIKGIRLHAQLAGFDLGTNIEDITEMPAGKSSDDGRNYRATMENPLPSWMRTLLISPDQFHVDLTVDQDGTPRVLHPAQTERELIGLNPWTGGLADIAQDTANMVSNANVGNGLKLLSDAAITAGMTYAGSRLGGKWLGAAGATLSPVVIDLIRRQFE